MKKDMKEMKNEMMKNAMGAKVSMRGNLAASDNKGRKQETVKEVALNGGKMEGSCYDHDRQSMQ